MSKSGCLLMRDCFCLLAKVQLNAFFLRLKYFGIYEIETKNFFVPSQILFTFLLFSQPLNLVSLIENRQTISQMFFFGVW